MPPGHRTTGQSRPGSGTQFDRPGHPVCAVPSQLPLLTRAPGDGNDLSPVNPSPGTKKAAHPWTATNIIPDFGTNDKTEHSCVACLDGRPLAEGGSAPRTHIDPASASTMRGSHWLPAPRHSSVSASERLNRGRYGRSFNIAR